MISIPVPSERRQWVKSDCHVSFGRSAWKRMYEVLGRFFGWAVISPAVLRCRQIAAGDTVTSWWCWRCHAMVWGPLSSPLVSRVVRSSMMRATWPHQWRVVWCGAVGIWVRTRCRPQPCIGLEASKPTMVTHRRRGRYRLGTGPSTTTDMVIKRAFDIPQQKLTNLSYVSRHRPFDSSAFLRSWSLDSEMMANFDESNIRPDARIRLERADPHGGLTVRVNGQLRRRRFRNAPSPIRNTGRSCHPETAKEPVTRGSINLQRSRRAG